MVDQGTWSNYQVEQWLSDLNGKWVGLHFDNPQVASAYASEVAGGSYVRKRLTITTPSSRTAWNAAALTWTGLPTVLLTYVAFWDVQYNGNLLGSSPLPAPIRVLSGGSWTLPAKQLALSFRSFG